MTADAFCRVVLHGSLAQQAEQFSAWLAHTPFAVNGAADSLPGPVIRLVDATQDGLDGLVLPARPELVIALVDTHPEGEAALAAGADDYLLPADLTPPGLARALRAAAERARLLEWVEALNAQLQAGAARFHNVISRNTDGAIVVDADGIIRFANPAAETLFGRPAATLVGEPLGFPVGAGENTELEVRHAAHDIRVVEMRVVETEWEGQRAFLLSLRDITERKHTEQALNAAVRRNHQLAAAIASLSVGVFITDPNLRNNPVVFVNDGFTAVTGYTPEAILGRSIQHLAGSDTNRELLRQLEQAFRQTQPFTGVLLQYRRDGEPFWGELTLNPVQDADGRLINFVGMLADVTYRKQAEQALLEREKLRVALDKEKELGQVKNLFMSTISHEFRTPLAVILSAADMLDHYLMQMSADQRRERLATIREQVRHLEDMLDEIQVVISAGLKRLDFHPVVMDVALFCRRLLDEIRGTVGREHNLVLVVADDRMVEAALDPRLVRHILNNLVSNAIKYSPAGSTVTLELAVGGGQVLFRVSDQGIGIPEDDQGRLFEPFHRGSNVGAISGTGLGLKVVHDCVQLHGGVVEIASSPGQGTVCTVRLPSTRWPAV